MALPSITSSSTHCHSLELMLPMGFSMAAMTAIYPISTGSTNAQMPNSPSSSLCSCPHRLAPGISTRASSSRAPKNSRMAAT